MDILTIREQLPVTTRTLLYGICRDDAMRFASDVCSIIQATMDPSVISFSSQLVRIHGEVDVKTGKTIALSFSFNPDFISASRRTKEEVFLGLDKTIAETPLYRLQVSKHELKEKLNEPCASEAETMTALNACIAEINSYKSNEYYGYIVRMVKGHRYEDSMLKNIEFELLKAAHN